MVLNCDPQPNVILELKHCDFSMGSMKHRIIYDSARQLDFTDFPDPGRRTSPGASIGRQPTPDQDVPPAIGWRSHLSSVINAVRCNRLFYRWIVLPSVSGAQEKKSSFKVVDIDWIRYFILATKRAHATDYREPRSFS